MGKNRQGRKYEAIWLVNMWGLGPLQTPAIVVVYGARANDLRTRLVSKVDSIAVRLGAGKHGLASGLVVIVFIEHSQIHVISNIDVLYIITFIRSFSEP